MSSGDVNIGDFKALLKEAMGLHPSSIGDVSIERAVNHRITTLGLSSTTEYLHYVKAHCEEVHHLVEEVVVPETWFFRNDAPFKALAWFIEKYSPEKRRYLRILSLPCSTGEEPYSIAITLLEHGVSASEFTIDAVDISGKALEKARKGVYTKYSFREEGYHYQEKYFTKADDVYYLAECVKRQVNYTRANVLDAAFCPGMDIYDVIFCRNLLIYFDKETQLKALEKFYAMLKPGGLFCLGHAETSQYNKANFLPLNYPSAFAYTKGEGVLPDRRSTASNVKALEDIYGKLASVVEKDRHIRNSILARENEKNTRPNKKHLEVSATEPDGIRQIDQLIDEGRLKEAKAVCESSLNENHDEDEAYYYLGFIASLEGRLAEAESYLRKSIYLDPDHIRALSLLERMLGQRGDVDQARQLALRKARAKRRIEGEE